VLAEQNVVRRYPVDPERIYIAGFSGGSRVAMRLALGYPDVFRGALLNAGSDPIGDADVPLPPRDLFPSVSEFNASRLPHGRGGPGSFRNGGRQHHIDAEVVACSISTPRSRTTLVTRWPILRPCPGRLKALLNPERPEPNRLAACRSGIETELAAGLRNAESLIASGKRDAARESLSEIDQHFGGLAAPRSIDLAQRARSAAVKPRHPPVAVAGTIGRLLSDWSNCLGWVPDGSRLKRPVTQEMSPMNTLSRRDAVLLVLLTLAWGFTWPVMKYGVRELPPLFFPDAVHRGVRCRSSRWSRL